MNSKKRVHAKDDNSLGSVNESSGREVNRRSNNLNEGGMPQCARIINKIL